MTTYKTYQESKIANPESDIYELDNGVFVADGWIDHRNYGKHTFELCNPADYCMTVEKFLSDGYKFVEADLILDEGLIYVVSDCKQQNNWYDTESVNKPDCNDDVRYILRAAVLENIPTETPEEKEVLDSIKSVGCVEWKNGDLPPVGAECELSNCGNSWVKAEVLFMGTGLCVVNQGYGDQHYHLNSVKFRKPETPQQREKRILEELADEACENLFGDSIKNCRPVVAETVRWMINYGYRKQD